MTRTSWIVSSVPPLPCPLLRSGGEGEEFFRDVLPRAAARGLAFALAINMSRLRRFKMERLDRQIARRRILKRARWHLPKKRLADYATALHGSYKAQPVGRPVDNFILCLAAYGWEMR